MSYQEDLILSMYGKGEPGLAMGGEEEGGRSPYEPYRPAAPTGPFVPAPGKDKELASGYHTTSNGGLVDMSGRVFYNDNGTLRLDGDYDPDIHGELFPPIDEANRSMQINQDIANITPKDFSPPPFRYMPHIRIPSIKDAEMKHMKNFIEAMGGSTKGLTKRKNDPLTIATHDKKGIGRNSPPASSGDNLAPDWLIDYMNRKDENLLQIQDRLRKV